MGWNHQPVKFSFFLSVAFPLVRAPERRELDHRTTVEKSIQRCLPGVYGASGPAVEALRLGCFQTVGGMVEMMMMMMMMMMMKHYTYMIYSKWMEMLAMWVLWMMWFIWNARRMWRILVECECKYACHPSAEHSQMTRICIRVKPLRGTCLTQHEHCLFAWAIIATAHQSTILWP